MGASAGWGAARQSRFCKDRPSKARCLDPHPPNRRASITTKRPDTLNVTGRYGTHENYVGSIHPVSRSAPTNRFLTVNARGPRSAAPQIWSSGPANLFIPASPASFWPPLPGRAAAARRSRGPAHKRAAPGRGARRGPLASVAWTGLSNRAFSGLQPLQPLLSRMVIAPCRWAASREQGAARPIALTLAQNRYAPGC